MNIFKQQKAEDLLEEFISRKREVYNGDIRREVQEAGFCYIAEYLPNLTYKEFEQVAAEYL
jgi:hypothetical protein